MGNEGSSSVENFVIKKSIAEEKMRPIISSYSTPNGYKFLIDSILSPNQELLNNPKKLHRFKLAKERFIRDIIDNKKPLREDIGDDELENVLKDILNAPMQQSEAATVKKKRNVGMNQMVALIFRYGLDDTAGDFRNRSFFDVNMALDINNAEGLAKKGMILLKTNFRQSVIRRLMKAIQT